MVANNLAICLLLMGC
ncbi:hypothetical protein KGM_203945 [Danaus plexippus plexippus]|uniref:Uncharacterized protein n=1 Tax=Danaus plexippus plexippus TaxID=278856 RepID=A0A212ENZ8_DANPL|nr:hypothetical protein KGM_203945 [Danaus plexippus plexippus]